MMYENASFAVRGSIVALVTPMLENGQLDLPALRARAAIQPRKRLNWRVTRKKRAQARVCRSCRTTTNRRNTGYSVILRRLPRRTVADLSLETVVKLAQVPGIVGIKDATGQIARGMELIRCVPAHFSVYSGDDLSAVALMLMGGHGNISVTANVAPRAMHALCSAALAADAQRARALQLKLLPLHRALFIESNPIPVKWALARLGKIRNGIRLPLTPLDSR